MPTLRISVDGVPATPQSSALFGPAGGTIGRADGNALVLSDPERSVSRLHARIEWDRGGFAIVNQGINPVLCNGRVVVTGARSAIAAGDQLRIGRFVLAVQAVLPPGSAPRDGELRPEGGEDEALFDDMTGLPLPARPGLLAAEADLQASRQQQAAPVTAAVAQPKVAAPAPASMSALAAMAERTIVRSRAQPPTLGTAVALAPPAESLDPRARWFSDLLRGLGCATPTWTSPPAPQQFEELGRLMRAALDEAVAGCSSGHGTEPQAGDWFLVFEQAFMRACRAGAAPALDRSQPR